MNFGQELKGKVIMQKREIVFIIIAVPLRFDPLLFRKVGDKSKRPEGCWQ